jgi:glucosamine kinase
LTQDIFIGVDGGGSKSTISIEDHDGKLIGETISGPANIRLSVENAWRSIYSGVEKILQPQGVSLADKNYRFHLGLGLAGCEATEAVHAFLNCPHPFTTVELNTDAHIACIGAHQNADGAIIIVGTGVVGYQMQAGQSTRVSGWGFPHDDEGSGAWLGLEATRLTFQWLDQRSEKSPLVEAIFSYFNRDQQQFITWATRANSTEFARLAPIVIQHSQQEEITAVQLMKKAAHAIDKINQALKKIAVLPCCLLGGVAPFVKPWLNTNFVEEKNNAVTGAILMVREQVKKDML